jgi:hypothetical protein
LSSTKTNTSTTENRYQRMPGASSPDIDTLRSSEFKVDPSIGYRAAGSRNRLNASLLNPTGGYTTPQIQDARRMSANREIDEQAAMAGRAGQFDVNNLNMGKMQYLAGLTAPPLVQSGSSSTDKFKTPFSAKIMPALQTGAQVAANMGAGG